MSDQTLAARKVFDPLPDILETSSIVKLRQRFLREVKVQSGLSPDFFIPVLAAEHNSDSPWFLMPLADGTFTEAIEDSRARNDFPQQGLADVLNTLEELHNLGFVHRDLKPANILKHDGRWKLADFGLVLPPSGLTTMLTSALSRWGTTQYCAPEQAEDFHHTTAATDIYAFGCILHDLVVGGLRAPYRQQTADGPLRDIIERCTDPVPRRRFRNVAALRGDLFAQLSRGMAVTGNSSTTGWAAELETAAEWDESKLAKFVGFLRRHRESNAGLWPVFFRLDEEVFKLLNSENPEYANEVAVAYCEWARNSFDAAYCDVIVRRLETIFEIGDIGVKAAAAVTAAMLAQTHDRWFVMRRLLSLCGPSLEDNIAQRIAIEIEVEDAAQCFVTSAERLHRTLDQFHPFIAKRLAHAAD